MFIIPSDWYKKHIEKQLEAQKSFHNKNKNLGILVAVSLLLVSIIVAIFEFIK